MSNIEEIENDHEINEWSRMISEVKKNINKASDTPVKTKNQDKSIKDESISIMRPNLYLRHLIRDKKVFNP